MSYFAKPISIGSAQLSNRVFLAPLAGVSDVPFRRICQELGAGLTYVEMLSAMAIHHNSKRTFRMMSRHESESVLGVQVTGATSEQIADAVEVLDRQGFDTIDINMGCPVRKIVSKGWGSALLKDPQRITEIVTAAKQRTSKPLSMKCRIGFCRETMNIDDIATHAGLGKVDMLIIHGRTRTEDYASPVDYDSIRRGVDRVSHIVTVGNGDVFDYHTAHDMVQRTGCDAVMVSRGALGNPWVFNEITQGKAINPLPDEWLDVVLRHLDYHEAFYGSDGWAVASARKHLLWYCIGFPGARPLRDKLGVVSDLDVARQMLRTYAAGLPADLEREHPARGLHHGYNQHLNRDPRQAMDRKIDRGVGDDEGVEDRVGVRVHGSTGVKI